MVFKNMLEYVKFKKFVLQQSQTKRQHNLTVIEKKLRNLLCFTLILKHIKKITHQSKIHTQKKQILSEHKLAGFSIYTCSSANTAINKLTYYRGPEATQKFCEYLKYHLDQIIDYKNAPYRVMNKQQNDEYNSQSKCKVCNDSFNKDKVKYYCYYSDNYLFAAHEKCMIGSTQKQIPIRFHNGFVNSTFGKF